MHISEPIDEQQKTEIEKKMIRLFRFDGFFFFFWMSDFIFISTFHSQILKSDFNTGYSKITALDFLATFNLFSWWLQYIIYRMEYVHMKHCVKDT